MNTVGAAFNSVTKVLFVPPALTAAHINQESQDGVTC